MEFIRVNILQVIVPLLLTVLVISLIAILRNFRGATRTVTQMQQKEKEPEENDERFVTAVRRRRGSRLSLPCILTTGWINTLKQNQEKILFEITPDFVRLLTQTWRRVVTRKNNVTYNLVVIGQRFEPVRLKRLLLKEVVARTWNNYSDRES